MCFNINHLVTSASMRSTRKGKYFLIPRWTEFRVKEDWKASIKRTEEFASLHCYDTLLCKFFFICGDLQGSTKVATQQRGPRFLTLQSSSQEQQVGALFQRPQVSFRGNLWSKIPCLPPLFSRKTLVFHLGWYFANTLSQRHWGPWGMECCPWARCL